LFIEYPTGNGISQATRNRRWIQYRPSGMGEKAVPAAAFAAFQETMPDDSMETAIVILHSHH